MKRKYELRDKLIYKLNTLSVKPDVINSILKREGTAPIKQSVKAVELLKRPQMCMNHLIEMDEELKEWIENIGALEGEVKDSAEIIIKYDGYIEREKKLAEKMKRLEHVNIPETIKYGSFNSLSTEAKQKLKKIKPKTLGQASRISGVSPADISVLLVHLRK